VLFFLLRFTLFWEAFYVRRERVSDDIYVFTSELYAQVTASAVVTRDGIVVIDTLPFPVETGEMIEYLKALGQGPIKYLVNTHWHGDHTNGIIYSMILLN
jgi:glyoxylase-like metal-dependent hydrolase (beta-lactamase superfamily II)